MPNPGQRNFGSNNTSINGPAAPAPSSSEVALWEQFDLAHRSVAQQLDHAIERDHGLNSHGFELLRALASATEKRLWMSDLAVRLGLTRSGVTRPLKDWKPAEALFVCGTISTAASFMPS